MTVVPFPFDMLMRPIRYVEAEDLTQAAIALVIGHEAAKLQTIDGEILGPGNHAASGLGRTVCTKGCVAFGGECFIASFAENNDKAVKRGTLDDGGNLVWHPAFTVGGVDIKGISYCGGAFFVTSRSEHVGDIFSPRTLYIARSIDGIAWSEQTFMAGGYNCGSVAYEKTNELYCHVGEQAASPSALYTTLYSATSVDGMTWTNHTSGNPYSAGFPTGVGAGNGGFVTGGFKFSVGTPNTAAAQANASSDGIGWTAVDLPVIGGTAAHDSFCTSVVFVDAGEEAGGGYFVGAVIGNSYRVPAYALRSTNGTSWSIIGQWGDPSDPANGYVYATGLSVIGTDIGEIVVI